MSDCTYKLTLPDGQERTIIGKAAMKAFLVEEGMSLFYPNGFNPNASTQAGSTLASPDLNAMFNDVLAEEIAKDEAKAQKLGTPKAQTRPRSASQAAASAAKNTAAALTNAIDGLGALFGQTPPTDGTINLNSGIPVKIDADTYSKAKPLFQQAIANLGDAGSDLKEAMRAVVRMVLDKFGIQAARNMQPYVVQFIEDVQNERQLTNGEQDVPSADARVERDSNEPATERAMVPTVSRDAGDVPGAAGQAGGQAAGADGGGRPGNSGVPAGGAAADRERGDFSVPGGVAAADAASIASGAEFSERGSDVGFDGVRNDPIPAAQVDAVAVKVPDRLAKLAQQRAAEKVAVKPGDLDNIKATLPYLLEGQQEDVLKAETRFAKPDGYGMLFTNGTGTGKTFTGLGVVKRMQRQGKDNILIVVPDDKIAADWVKSGEPLGLSISGLKDTKDAGKGIVITTYANLGDNDALARRQWDMVVADEAHTLMQSADGKVTTYLANLRAITNHPDGAYQRHTMLNRKDIDALAKISEQIDANTKILNNNDTMDAMMVSVRADNERLQKDADALAKKLREASDAVRAEVQAAQGAGRTRLLALSATPFAYEFTVDWANGYLFDYNEGQASDKTESRGYNQGSNRDRFFMTRFGYTMRYNKLTKPDPAQVDSGLMQREFNTWLKKSGSLSGRMLDVPADYDRRFVLVDSGIGNQIDDALNWINEKRREAKQGDLGFATLNHTINDKFDYLSRRYLLEAIKATEVVPIVRQHMALGRKVVVFHDYKKGGGFNPFDIEVPGNPSPNATPEHLQDFNSYKAAVTEFRAKFKDLVNAPLSQLDSPIEVFKREIPGVLLVNGDEKKAALLERYEKFQDDASGPQVMLVQSAKNKGWSGHDTTGKHQRVLINLGQPTAPTMAIQQEGRIYRTGQVTDAIMRYLNTGTSWERMTFAQTIAGRASAAENLGMGEQARALKDAFIDAFNEADTYAPGHEGEGKGGKERDKMANAAITAFDRAKTYYWGNQKKTSKTKAQEGKDYFATPEPLGYKMAEWLGLRGGESALEPSAGHGAIARWLPENANRTAIEPSNVLRARLAMAMDASKDRLIDGTFEDHAIVNKYDGIVMNPPFGVGGKTAIEHLDKATKHLRDGGRIVALIPTGPAADKRFYQWMYGESERPTKPLYVHPEYGPIYKGDTLTLSGFGASRTIVVDKVDGAANGPRYVRDANTGLDGAINAVAISKVEPTGPRTETYRAAEGIYTVAEIKLPQVTFERAGTAVATRIVILEKQSDAARAPNASSPIDLTDITDIGKLFDRIEDMKVQPRAMTAAQEAADKADKAGAQPAKKAEAKTPKAANPAAVGTVDRGDAKVIEHITQKGKTIYGIVRKDLSKEAAQKIDPYTFRKDGGFFIRAQYLKPEGADAATGNNGPANKDIRRSFAGARAATSDTHALVTAQDRLDAGEDPEAVRRETGWFKGVDGKWRFEIDDSRAFLKGTGTFGDVVMARMAALEQGGLRNAGDPVRLGDVLRHESLFAAYPALRDIEVQFTPRGVRAKGRMLRTTVNGKANSTTIQIGADLSADEALNVLLHEVQHGIQDIEGFATGGTPSDFAKDLPDGSYDNGFDTYKRTAGEVEARNTQARQKLTAEQRLATSPGQTADVADADVIVVFNGKEMANAPMPANAAPDGPATAQPLRTPAATIRAAITKAYGKLLGQLESKGLVTLTQTLDQAIEAAAQARAAKTGQPLAEVRASLMGSVSNSVATDTPAFKRWFKDSKAVDADGKPLVVMHASTYGDISEFKKEAQRFGKAGFGFYFSDASGSNLFAEYGDRFQMERSASGEQKAVKTYPVYLSLQNPLVVDHVDDLARHLDRGQKFGVARGLFGNLPADAMLWLQRQGYDGIITRETTAPRVHKTRGLKILDRNDPKAVSFPVYVAFEPAQIKSAIGNNGNFDPNDLDIRRSANGAIQGFFDPQTGQSFLIADNLSAEAAPGVLMHEVGIHMAADGTMQPLFERAARILKAQKGNAFMQRVQAKLDAAGETSPEEVAAYLVEAYENDRANAPASVTKWLADLLATVKAWLYKKGIVGADSLTVADIAAVARANAKSIAAIESSKDAQPGGIDYSVVQQLQSDNFYENYRKALDEGRTLTDAEITAGLSGADKGGQRRGVLGFSGSKNPSTATVFWESEVLGGGYYTTAMMRGKDGKREFIMFAIPERAAPDGAPEQLKDAVRSSKVILHAAAREMDDGSWEFAVDGAHPASPYYDELIERGELEPVANGYHRLKMKDASQNDFLREAARRLSMALDGKTPDIRYTRMTGWNSGRGPVTLPSSKVEAKFSRATAQPTPAPATWQAPSLEDAKHRTAWDNIVYTLQDKMVDVKRVVQAIRETGQQIEDDQDVYLQEELYHARVSHKSQEFVQKELDPMVKLLADRGVELADFEQYLHARHAPEANRVMMERNPTAQELQDRMDAIYAQIEPLEAFKAIAAPKEQARLQRLIDQGIRKIELLTTVQPWRGTEEDRQKLSGMSNDEAAAVLASISPEAMQTMQEAARQFDAIVKKNRQEMVDYDLENQDTVDGWADMFQFYVPLMREDEGNAQGTGQGFSIKGREVKSRTGSTKKVVDIVANLAMQRERTIVRGEKNRVSQALVGLASANPNPDFWRVGGPDLERKFDLRTGTVKTVTNPNYKSLPNVVTAKVRGADGAVKEVAVVFNEDDNRALRMAATLKNLDGQTLEGLYAMAAPITRYLAAMSTQYNPIFGITNLARDLQGAMVNLAGTPLADQKGKIAWLAKNAIVDIYRAARADRKNEAHTGDWGQWWDMFQEDGGPTGYRDIFQDSADRTKAITKTMNPDAWMESAFGKVATAGGKLKDPAAAVAKGKGWVFDWLSDYNLAMENGIRVSTYRAAVESGMSRQRAASLAKNITVNFNRKGQMALKTGALYAFFNAAVQGTARIGQALVTMEPGKPKTMRLSPLGKKVVYGGILLGALQAAALAAMGFDDENPPDFVRERNTIIPIGGGKFITIPMPLGLHVFPGIGRHAVEFMLSGGKDPSKRAIKVLGMMVDSFYPLGSAGASMQTLAPTALDPLAALMENRDYAGRPIARESMDKNVPGHELTRTTATWISQGISEGINWITGGDKYVAGVVSPTPDQIDYLIGQATGGVGRELLKLAQSGQAAYTGEELPMHKVPLLGRFFGTANGSASQSSSFYAKVNEAKRIDRRIDGLREDGQRQEAQTLERSHQFLLAKARIADRQVTRLRREKRKLLESGAPREQVRDVERQMADAMRRFNEATVKP